MAYNKDIVEKLSQFNNLSFTKKQWEIILKGCGCPKSPLFWAALRDNNMIIDNRTFTLVDFTEESFDKVYKQYSITNVASATKAQRKRKLRERAIERSKKVVNHTFFMVGGYLTTELPEKDI